MTVNPAIYETGIADYVRSHGIRLDPIFNEFSTEIARHEHAEMASAPEQMALIAFLLKTVAAKNVLEIGCFLGYGTLAMAMALPDDGRLTTLDVNDDWAAIGKRFWEKAGVDQKIEFRSGLAKDSLDNLLAERASFDFIYIDADKSSYKTYYKKSLELLKPGGLMALDNMLWGGTVADPKDQSRQTVTLRELTKELQQDKRIEACLIPFADGMTLLRKIT